jgi:hypothetical protein
LRSDSTTNIFESTDSPMSRERKRRRAKEIEEDDEEDVYVDG